MQNFAIGLSGLHAVQAAMDVVGNNVANADTEGYHRQRVDLAPSICGQTGTGIGAGVDILGVRRLIDTFLDGEITRQESSQGQVSQELSILEAVETTFGEFGEGGGLNVLIDTFFDSLRTLAAHPLEQVQRNEVISSAGILASAFRQMGTSLENREDQMVREAQHVIDSVNALTRQIGELNGKIQAIEIGQGQANNLRDHRDRLITELAGLVGVEVQQREYGTVDVAIAGAPVVTGSIVLDLGISLQSDGILIVTAGDNESRGLRIQGGRLSGLLTLKNELLREIRGGLDTLAQALINRVNQHHVQGLGRDGSFSELSGWPIDAMDWTGMLAPVTDGTFYVRVTNSATGEVQRHAVDVDISGSPPDTPTSVAAKIDAIDGLHASITSSGLHIAGDPDYTFDFIPAVLSEPTATNFTAAFPPGVSVSGVYTGQDNHVFTFTVAGSGSVGNGGLQLEVTDENGETVNVVSIGEGYAAGDTIELHNGIRIVVGTGQLNAGDSFEVEALATTDTSGFLAAAGMNVFFSGTSASEMQISKDILDAPDRIATAFGSDFTDNAGAMGLAGIRDESIDGLGGRTASGYYHTLISDLGQSVASRQSRQENIEAVVQNLKKQQSEVSAVNINDEAAHLLVLEKTFQAVAKYMTTLQTMLTALMDII